MGDSNFDLIVVGSGPGGYVAAIRASQLGLRAAVVEREHLGGVCLNWGCIPTKALLRTAEIRHLLGHLDEHGFTVNDVQFDFAKVVKRSRKVAKRLAAGVKHLLKKNAVEVVNGHARLLGPGRLEVASEGGTRSLEAKHIVLATGAHARTLPGLEPDGDRIWSYKEAMVPESLPESLLVVGSGAIGMEFASFYSDMGSHVTVVEILPQILPAEDAEIAAAARRSFEKRGIEIHTGAEVAALMNRGEAVSATLRLMDGSSKELSVDRAILAVGIAGNVEDIGLETTAIRSDRGHIVVNEWLETDEPGHYAIGDVAGPPWLAHKASHEAVLCVEKIAGVEGVRPLDTSRIPGCTYCRPQVASVGLTEAQALEAGHEVRVGRFPFQANGKAVALGEVEGLVKTVFDAATGELLGAHLFGGEVTELIQGFAIARTLEATEAELMQAVFPHPTLSEAMHEAVLDAYGRALHT
ncbi:MAG: dihydrolipoyl dehydrogenase [Deltaproteobacteria bacterium]|nr:dihydrolipoyl dehydrogenase [Deltaproteobacteria bacterium]MBW2399437.1 dihydrolipoyl dehydrogenase [Deltaproteobacteria bacterium]MBW2665326.1 dihydrolipoyl dehydrogenase [Deltaproteobacteria bacterium]